MGRVVGQKNRVIGEVPCENCGNPFVKTRKDARSCSRPCTLAMYKSGHTVRKPRVNTQSYLSLRADGLTYQTIADRFGVSKQAVQQAVTAHASQDAAMHKRQKRKVV